MLPPREDWATIKKISWIRTNDTWIPTRRNSLFTAADLIWCPVIQSQGNFCITQRWLRHLFIDVPPYRSGLWDEVTPHYVNWAFFYDHVTGAGFEPANSGLWAQNDTTSPPRDRNRSYYRTTDRGFAKCFLELKCSEVTVFYGILLNKIRQQS